MIHTFFPPKSIQRFLTWNHFAPAAVFGFIALVYWRERSFGPGWGDSMGFILCSLEGFEWAVNATGHFLYNTLNVALVDILPWSDPLILLTLVSIVFAVLTLIQIYRMAIMLTGSRFAALMGTVAFGFSFAFWRQAEQVEVYTLATFTVASAIYFMLEDTISCAYRHMTASGVWVGIAVLVHIQTILLLPFYLMYLFRGWRKTKNVQPIILSTGAVGTAFLLLIIPAAMLPHYTVSSIFFDFGFRNEVVRFSVPGILSGFGMSIAYLLYSFNFHIAAATAGFLVCRRTTPEVYSLVMTGIIPIWVFAMRFPVTDQYVFFLNAYIFIAILAAYGYRSLMNALPGRFACSAVLILAILVPQAEYKVALTTAVRIPLFQAFHRERAYKGGLSYYLLPGLRKSPIFNPAAADWVETGIPAELHDRLVRNIHDYQVLLDQRRR